MSESLIVVGGVRVLGLRAAFVPLVGAPNPRGPARQPPPQQPGNPRPPRQQPPGPNTPPPASAQPAPHSTTTLPDRLLVAPAIHAEPRRQVASPQEEKPPPFLVMLRGW